ncbi:hypothetical protein AAFF_G00355210 [Aldrovandia affinis]|uniref:Uncharacterized protein n=1 Tax=Aldrovandia affinis TaxID=143900 RepID=A0AAD7WP85_9TELE|nr:hypothetical protein AAFF_G00355210 [Aldrovandia affinis]
MLRCSSLICPSQSCLSRLKRSRSSDLSWLHLFSLCCSFQRKSMVVLWFSASSRLCSSRSCFSASPTSSMFGALPCSSYSSPEGKKPKIIHRCRITPQL